MKNLAIRRIEYLLTTLEEVERVAKVTPSYNVDIVCRAIKSLVNFELDALSDELTGRDYLPERSVVGVIRELDFAVTELEESELTNKLVCLMYDISQPDWNLPKGDRHNAR